jgi:hypothetical protein
MTTSYGIRIDGGDFITELQRDPLDLGTAKRLALDMSRDDRNRDSCVEVVSRSPDPIGAGWQDTAAAFVNGEKLDRSDERFPGR